MRLPSICLLIVSLLSSTLAVSPRRVRGPGFFRPGRISSPLEDFQTDGAAVPFVGCDAVEFTGCVAQASGVEFGVVNATVYDLVRDDTLLATARVMGDGEIVVTHT
ncbi:ankyrin repeat protein [Aspergillus fumigatus Z5]|nr:ankyrin repeat protein [Aspergillus fumigatus Z5]